MDTPKMVDPIEFAICFANNIATCHEESGIRSAWSLQTLTAGTGTPCFLVAGSYLAAWYCVLGRVTRIGWGQHVFRFRESLPAISLPELIAKAFLQRDFPLSVMVLKLRQILLVWISVLEVAVHMGG